MFHINKGVNWILDNDDTIVNSSQFIRPAHAQAIKKISKLSYKESMELFLEKGTAAVEEFGINIQDFYNSIYQAPDYIGLAMTGDFKVFDDARRFLNDNGDPAVVVSNIAGSVTRMKLQATMAYYNFVNIIGASDRGKRKPSLYLAEEAIESLDNQGYYHPNTPLVVVGDMSYDIEFGQNIKDNLHKNTITVQIDRGHSDEMKVKPDIIVNNLNDIYDLI